MGMAFQSDEGGREVAASMTAMILLFFLPVILGYERYYFHDE